MPRLRPAVTKALTGFASNSPSRCSGTLKAAAAAGLHVVGFKIDPQGKIEVVIGKPEAQDPAPLDTWMMTKHARSTEGH